MEYDLPGLRDQLVETYSESELRDLCFELRIDHEIIEGRNKSEKARELLTYLNRRNRIPELILTCKKQRPSREWNLILSQQAQSEEFRQQLGLDTSVRSKYLDLKFEIYRNVWQSLYALKEAGDELWESASKENTANFAALLRQARNLVGINAIFFDQADYEALIQILDQFGKFEAGKVRLSRIRSERDEEYIPSGGVLFQIQKNRELKMEYEMLLSRVLTNFSMRVEEFAA